MPGGPRKRRGRKIRKEKSKTHRLKKRDSLEMKVKRTRRLEGQLKKLDDTINGLNLALRRDEASSYLTPQQRTEYLHKLRRLIEKRKVLRNKMTSG